MRKKIIFGVVIISLITMNLTTSFHPKKDVISLVNLELLSSASAEDSEGGEETYDNKFKKKHTETTTIWFKFDLSGNVIVCEAHAEGSWSQTITDEWDCCATGGSGCLKSNPDCP